jgi:hypothetical protein
MYHRLMADDFELIGPDDTAYRLDLTPTQTTVTRTALRSLRANFGHDEHDVQQVVRAALAKLPESGGESGVHWLELTPAQLKITYTALRSLLDDFGHDEHELHRAIREVIDKLPDEHAIRAIDLKRELRGGEAAA